MCLHTHYTHIIDDYSSVLISHAYNVVTLEMTMVFCQKYCDDFVASSDLSSDLEKRYLSCITIKPKNVNII